MRAGYAAVAIAGGAAAYLVRSSRVSAILLAVFAVGAFLIGLMPPTGGKGPADELFPYLQFAPVAFFPAIAWISWRMRRRALVVLAALAWLLFLPLVSGEPPGGGLINRAADLAMGGMARHVRNGGPACAGELGATAGGVANLLATLAAEEFCVVRSPPASLQA